VLRSIALFPKNCSAPSHPLFLPALTFPSHSPQPVPRLLLPPTHSSPADQPTIPTLHNPNTLQSLTQIPSTTTTQIYPNTHKDHKRQQPLHCFLHLPTLLPTSPFSATLSNSPNFYS
jgi:hypothetical protein